MVSGAIQVLTLLAMTAHVVFGCCWHHAHGPAAHAAEAPEHHGHHDLAAAAVRHYCGHHHGPAEKTAASDDHAPGDSCPHHRGDCHEETCKYLTSPQPKVAGADVQALGPATDSTVFVEAVALAFYRIRFSGHVPPDLSGRHCVRSRTQVWLL